MQLSEKYEKVSWVFQIPEIIQEGEFCKNRLASLDDDIQQKIIKKLINSLSKFFGKMPDNIENNSLLSLEKTKEHLENIIKTWKSGLCDLPVKQIIDGLLDIILLKTEYQKYPPRSVMEFYAICKKNKVNSNNFNTTRSHEKMSSEQSLEYLINVHKKYGNGKSYHEYLKERISFLENKVKEEKLLAMEDAELRMGMKYLLILEKGANI